MSARETSFQCHFPGCGLRYRRKEHLTRHARRHFQPESFECPFCDRVFARNDTLRQHVRIRHKNRELHSGRAIRACNYCRSRRSRCDGKVPCETCLGKGIQCSFARSSPRPKVEQQRSPTISTTPGTLGEPNYQYTAYASSNLIRNSDSIERSPCRMLPYIQAYFEKFHPNWPFLHRATFDVDREPTLLVQSVVMMGLWLTGENNAQLAAMDLHSELTLLIHQQRDKWDVSNQHEMSPGSLSPWPMATYQGILLHITFALIKGNGKQLDLQLTHQLSEIPSQLLVALVDCCRKREMLFYPSMLAQFNADSLPGVYIWLGIEEAKRFALALYKVCRCCRVHDTLLSYGGSMDSHLQIKLCAQVSSLLSLADLQFALPDSDELWHASSNLASRVADNACAYWEKNAEENWICQAARLLQTPGGFNWI
ncbi:C6 and C2H2 transcription factor, putative [Talaromyces stipitatus ATCC 10500]|uniref:C6 and C2H2 transcription factor, putative n=1 Tax=Talaromyces stipitatus (strain ATCC 10500 / CBS 375.48 / QM 6759 / NRRL 1006) TaxID=441959 RepID=B8LXY9_TALSN|nr:C6 and C2H2 transcription factor, putative [Talaromyces stipitatus ATCC 10500]EED22804.1 C6 and C2H2 transcription factor, putative [Talaromyces stipitatus ATCC 10500]